MELLFEYLLFLAKTVTLVAAIMFVVIGLASSIGRAREMLTHERLEVKRLNDRFEAMADNIKDEMLTPAELKALHKERKREEKAKRKAKPAADEKRKPRLFVIDFNGDIRASQVTALREEITAILTVAEDQDEVVVRLESPGGMVHGYGLAGSQLQRLRDRNIKLTACVDKVAASGGYLMACVADRIVAAPFAVIGSIGVIAQIPNFNKLLKRHDVDMEILTAGEYKRTVTMFGENNDEDRAKMQEELEVTHQQFKDFVTRFRSDVEISKVATGEHWQAMEAYEMKLVDSLQTSDDYLLDASRDKELLQVKYHGKKTLSTRLASATEEAVERVMSRFAVWR